MKKKLIEDALTDSKNIHEMISETNDGVKSGSNTLKNVSMTLKIENNRIQDNSGIATGIAPLAHEIERVTKDMNKNVTELILYHRDRLAECNDILRFFSNTIIQNENIDISKLISSLTELTESGKETITNLDLNELALQAGNLDITKLSPNANKYIKSEVYRNGIQRR